MNHVKYLELIDRVERQIQSAKDLSINTMATQIVDHLMPELEGAPMADSDKEDLNNLAHLVKVVTNQHSQLSALVTRLVGSVEKLNALQTGADQRLNGLETFTNRRVQALHERIQKLEEASTGFVGDLQRILKETP